MTFLRWFISGVWMLTFFGGVSAQDYYGFPARLKYVVHSFESGHFEASRFEAESLLQSAQSKSADSLHFYAGWASQQLQQNLPASVHFQQISSEFPQYRFAHTFLAWQAWKDKNVPAFESEVKDLTAGDDQFRDYGQLLNANRLLFARDTVGYRTSRQSYVPRDLYVRQAFLKLDAAVVDFGKKKEKKPATAGLLSAMVPGAGKAYLGKWPSAGMTLLGMGAIGVQAWEGYRKGGVKSPQFIAFSGLFLLFYSGNIVGSVTQAKSYNVQLVSDFRHSVGLQVDLCFERLFAP